MSTSDQERNPEVSKAETFQSLGLIQPLLEAIKQLKYKRPTDIQAACIPPALTGRDIIGVASTGSGKTAAFALPILQRLWDQPQGLFACVLSPTHELAFQIAHQFEALGSAMGVRCAVIVGGGDDQVRQAIMLAKRPHVVVATPGRLLDHLTNTKGFNLRSVKYLVIPMVSFVLLGMLTIRPGLGRGRSSARLGLWEDHRSDSQGYPQRAYNVPLFRYDDNESHQTAESQPHEPREGRDYD